MGEASMRKWMRRARRAINARGGLCAWWRPGAPGPRPKGTPAVARQMRREHRAGTTAIASRMRQIMDALWERSLRDARG